jgi:hypothetical protein
MFNHDYYRIDIVKDSDARSRMYEQALKASSSVLINHDVRNQVHFYFFSFSIHNSRATSNQSARANY